MRNLKAMLIELHNKTANILYTKYTDIFFNLGELLENDKT